MQNHRKYILIFLILLISSLALIMGIIKPCLKKTREDNLLIQNQKQTIEKLLAKGQSINHNRQNLEEVQKNIDVLDTIFLKTGEELNFIMDLEKAAQKNNLEQVIKFDNNKGTQEAEITMVPIDLQISGNLKNIIAYINMLETFDYSINLTKIDISSQNRKKTKKNGLIIKAGEEKIKEMDLAVRLSGITYWK